MIKLCPCLSYFPGSFGHFEGLAFFLNGGTNLTPKQSSMIFYTILKNKRMRRCGVPPPPPPLIFERLKLPQQIIYRRKENLSESPNHLKYRENILISRFYEHFSRNSREFRPFLEVRKNFKLLECKHIIYHFEAGDLEMPNI